MSCRNRDDDCRYNGYPEFYRNGYPEFYRNGYRDDDCGCSGYGPQPYRRHHDEVIVDVHVEVPEHDRRYY